MSRKSMGAAVLCASALAAILGVPGPGSAVTECAPTTATGGGPWPGGEWRSYGGDQSNTRNQAAETTIGTAQVTTLAPVWTFTTPGAGADGDVTGTPVVADGCVYVGTTTGWVFALNADTGAVVWKTRLATESSFWQGGIFGSVGVGGGKIFVAVARTSSPFVMALDQATGQPAWAEAAVVDTQNGSELYSSPTVFDDDATDAQPPMVIVGVSGGSAEVGDQADRYAFHGSIVLLDSQTGALVKKVWTIPQDVWPQGYAGGSVWAPTPAIDPQTEHGYFGTGNPFQPDVQHPNTDAIVKLDLDRSRPTFGEIVGSYKGSVDEYFTQFADQPCVNAPQNPALGGLGSCFDLDLDFGTSVNLMKIAGRTVVGAGQKSGVYHAAYADTMTPAWTALVGNPSAVGGIVGSAAYNGESVTGPITPAGIVWSVRTDDGGYRWFAPVADALHYGQPVSTANGVAYTVDLKGFLDAYDLATGLPLLHRPMGLGGGTGALATPSFGGVSIARNTVYASVGTGGGTDGGVVAFRPGGGGGGGGGPEPPPPPTLPGGGLAVVAAPGSAATTYTTPVAVVRAGDEVLSFINFDVAPHDVRSTEGLFSTPVILLGGRAPVTFNAHLESGKTYGFFCSVHPNMIGRLLAI